MLMVAAGSWDQHYKREVSNFAECNDIGEVWFGEDSAFKMVRWIERNVEDTSARIADLGCGNAHLLFELVRRMVAWPLCRRY